LLFPLTTETEGLAMEANAAGNYQKGLRYLCGGGLFNAAPPQLEEADANAVRKLADILAAKGLHWLRSAVQPERS
jgi:hypothetical protein